MTRMRTSLLVAALGAIAAFGWQFLVVHSQYGGNWTGLYYTGDRYPPPPELAETIWVHPNSTGYDGQFYHYIAHDPLMRRGFDRAIDAPRLRYRRILVPAVANLLAFGQDRFVDGAYIGLIGASVFLGILWMSRMAQVHKISPWLG